MIKDLIKLANHLDSKGYRKEADYLDAVIRKVSEDDIVFYDVPEALKDVAPEVAQEAETEPLLDIGKFVRKKNPEQPNLWQKQRYLNRSLSNIRHEMGRGFRDRSRDHNSKGIDMGDNSYYAKGSNPKDDVNKALSEFNQEYPDYRPMAVSYTHLRAHET